MSSTLSITKQLSSDTTWLITASVVPGGTLPKDIFLYENTGGTTLGDYFGVCSLGELNTHTTFTGTAIPKFGNRFVKFHQSKTIVHLETDIPRVTSHLINSVKALSLAISSSPTTTELITIP